MDSFFVYQFNELSLDLKQLIRKGQTTGKTQAVNFGDHISRTLLKEIDKEASFYILDEYAQKVITKKAPITLSHRICFELYY